LIIRFQRTGDCYSLTDVVTESIGQCERYDVIVIEKIEKEVLDKIKGTNIKIFECDEGEEKCIEKIRNSVYRVTKSCKFT